MSQADVHRLTTFIRTNQEKIISEFAVFAKTLMPPGAEMTESELRDHAEDILTAIVTDMELIQSGEEQSQKSKGQGSARTMVISGRLHADDRIRHGFTFRLGPRRVPSAARHGPRLYEEHGASALPQVRRFNEAVDETLTESMHPFAVQTDLFRDQFIGIVSHDLRTPLGAVTMGAALLAQPEDDPHRRHRVVTGIINSAQRMERMIADLLDLTQARLGGTIPLKRREADLHKVCDEVVLESRAVRPEVMVRLETSGNLRGEWDPDRLGQVVSNLLGNAMQYGDGTPITLTTRDEGDAVTLAVHNGGAPIPTDVLPLIFEPLARGRGKARAAQHRVGIVHRARDRVSAWRRYSGDQLRYRNDLQGAPAEEWVMTLRFGRCKPCNFGTELANYCAMRRPPSFVQYYPLVFQPGNFGASRDSN